MQWPRTAQLSPNRYRGAIRWLRVLGLSSLGCVTLTLGLPACKVYDPMRLRESSDTVDGQRGEDAGPGAPSATASRADVANTDCVMRDDPDCPMRCRETCNGKDDDCDGETDESDDGSALCHLPGATSVCSRGVCVIASCDREHIDCNERPDDGCESTLDAVDHCGVCSARCAPANAEPACVEGDCQIASCQPNFGDCDERADNGCESDLGSLGNCGKCGQACSAAHAETACKTGRCEFDKCSAGFGDCNHDADKLGDGDGCESGLNSRDNCGRCGNRCPDATPFCSGGKCSAISCPSDRADCNGDSVDCETNLRSPQNCGACGTRCGNFSNAKASCSDGACEPSCNSGYGDCDHANNNGCETNLRNSNSHCGACGTSCRFANATPTCSNGSCQLMACNGGYGDCNNNTADGCEQHLNTNQSCGSCGKACSLANASASCSSGNCQISNCNSGFSNCDGTAANGCEINLKTDAQNCGACGQTCPDELSCQAGNCVCTSDSTCGNGQTCCSGACRDTKGDTNNCGGCGKVCASGQSCCNGSCADLANDFNNCGDCGKSCDSKDSDSCDNGSCRCGGDQSCRGLDRCCSGRCRFNLRCD